MSAGMADIIAAHWVKELPSTQLLFELQCQGPGCSWGGKLLYTDHAAHVAEELTRAGYGNVQEAKAEALTDAADWLLNGEVAGVIAYDGPSNRGEVVDAYDAALEDPEGWLRERADAALAIDPADLYWDERTGLADAWLEGRAASPDALNPYEDWSPLPDPLATALNDPEGQALVQAIHDRKAEG